MAKSAVGVLRAGNAAYGQRMDALYQLLSRLVEENKVLCPRSAVHDQETDLFRDANPEVARRIHRIARELSDGRGFHTYAAIEFEQTRRALRRYLAKDAEPEDGRWQHAFDSDPHAEVEVPRVYVQPPWPDAFVEEDRVRKTRMHAFRLGNGRLEKGARPSRSSICGEVRSQALGGNATTYPRASTSKLST
jgi:hypothetical protein